MQSQKNEKDTKQSNSGNHKNTSQSQSHGHSTKSNDQKTSSMKEDKGEDEGKGKK